MARQDGVITVQQACAAGMSTSAIERRVSSGQWQRLHRGVFLSRDHPRSPAAMLRAAVFRSGAAAVVYGPSAAWWQGLLPDPPPRQWITVPANRRVRPTAYLTVRHRNLHPADAVRYRGLPVTSLPLTVLEAAVELRNGSTVMDRALQGKVHIDALRAAHHRNLGRSGSQLAAKLLDAAADGGRSEAERLLVALLRADGLAGWRAQLPSCGYVIDVAFPGRRLAIEVDGWAWHRDAERCNADLHRQNVLVNAGWTVLRFTWHQLVHEPKLVIRHIRTALAKS